MLLSSTCSAQIYLLTKEEGGREKPLTHMFHVHLFSKTWDASTVGTLKDGKELMMPGENGVVRSCSHFPHAQSIVCCLLGVEH